MALPVLTAVSDAVWEADLVAALARGDLGVGVARRCLDLADLLATAATGQAQAVILSADLRRLDRDALSRLALARLAVLGLHTPGDCGDGCRTTGGVVAGRRDCGGGRCGCHLSRDAR